MSLEELATAQLPPEDIPEMVTDAQIAEKEHVNRLWEQEEDLNTVIFQNRDGSKPCITLTMPSNMWMKTAW